MAQAINILKEATSRDFSGGLDVADSELNLSSKFSRVLENLINGIDGSLEIRQGTKLFADIAVLSNYNITNIYFFYRYVIVMNKRGEVFAVDGQGTVIGIWNQIIAANKRAGLLIWPSADFVTFLEFNGELIISDGKNKPLVVTTALAIDYLADKGSGSNVNVPIGYVMEGYSNHVFIAGGYLLNVSERNASGTWTGDIATQYVGQFDMRSYVTKGDTTILGLHKFKNYLLVMFREITVPITIAEIPAVGGNPATLTIAVADDSVVEEYGCFSPRTAQNVGDEILDVDIVGVSSQALSTFTKILSPDRPSRFVDPMLQPIINNLPADALTFGTFSAYDRRLSTYMLFMPNNSRDLQQYVTCFAYREIDKLNIKSWSTLKGWNWCAACRSSEGNIFYARQNSTTIFLQGDAKTNPLNADFIGEQETFSDGTTFTDQTGFSPVASVAKSGVPIKWAWELPWSDLKHRALSKTLKYVILDTEGGEQFTLKVFIDDLRTGPDFGETFSDGTLFTDGTGFDPNSDPPYTPALTLELVGRDAGGYGVQAYGSSPFGGGNNTKKRTLTYAPTKFTTAKLRFEGEAMGPLKFVAITLLYQMGTIRRLP